MDVPRGDPQFFSRSFNAGGVTSIGSIAAPDVSFMDYYLGYFDDGTCRLEPIENPFRPKVLPPKCSYVFGINRHLCDRNEPKGMASPKAADPFSFVDLLGNLRPSDVSECG